MRGEVSHWERSAGEDEHVGAVIMVVLLAAIAFGVFFFWRLSTADVRAPDIDILGTRSEAAVHRPGSGYQPGSQPAVQQQTDAQVQAPAQALQQAQPAPQPTVQATAIPQANVAHVAHTDGVGVVLRSAPNDSAKMPRGFMDGAEVTVLERQGNDWVHVRGPGGQEGWVPATYLDQ